jgi:hypothetical protein
MLETKLPLKITADEAVRAVTRQVSIRQETQD